MNMRFCVPRGRTFAALHGAFLLVVAALTGCGLSRPRGVETPLSLETAPATWRHELAREYFLRAAPTRAAPNATLLMFAENPIHDAATEDDRRHRPKLLHGQTVRYPYDLLVDERFLRDPARTVYVTTMPPTVFWVDPERAQLRVATVNEWLSVSTPITSSRAQWGQPSSAPNLPGGRHPIAAAHDRSERFRVELIAATSLSDAISDTREVPGGPPYSTYLRAIALVDREIVVSPSPVPSFDLYRGTAEGITMAITHDSQYVFMYGLHSRRLFVAPTGLPRPEEPRAPAAPGSAPRNAETTTKGATP